MRPLCRALRKRRGAMPMRSVLEAYYTPFVRLEKGVIRHKDKRDVSPDENMVPRLIPQVIASEPEELRQLTDFLAELGYRELDVNMGCPFPLIVRRGKGAGILSSPVKVAALLEMMKTFPEIRFSVKMRLGGQEPDEWRALVPLLNNSCVTQVTLHPRIGKQQYKGMVDGRRSGHFMRLVSCRWSIMAICRRWPISGRCWKLFPD